MFGRDGTLNKIPGFLSDKREIFTRSALGERKIFKKHLRNVYKTYIVARVGASGFSLPQILEEP